jgi:PTS system mannose-specific IIB component
LENRGQIVLVRVDNRLVHGQLLEAWIPALAAEAVCIANDDVAGDIFRQTVIRMAVPGEIEVLMCPVAELPHLVPFSETKGKRIIVLFCNIADAVRAYKSGFCFSRLNLGNIFSDECLLACSRAVSLGKEDVEDLGRLLVEKGVTVEIQGVPRERPVNFATFLCNKDV